MIECESIYGDRKLIPKEKFAFRPSVYAIMTLCFFFICRPKTLEMVDDDQVDDLEAEKPRWVKLNSVRAGDLQICGEEILQVAHALAQL